MIYEQGTITVAFRVIVTPTGLNAHVGLAFSAPQDNFNRKVGSRIAVNRLNDNPLRFVPEDPLEKLEEKDVVFYVHSFLLLNRNWKNAGDPYTSRCRKDGSKRFPKQWMTEMIGGEGLVRAFADGHPPGFGVGMTVVDGPQLLPDIRGSHLPFDAGRGWVFRCIPNWTTDFLKGL